MYSYFPRQCFLGANSAHGFHSLYGGFCTAERGDFLHVIKGGPGCGKSSFMRRIGSAAEERGHDVKYILCSGDPDSLDGVYIPALGVGYVDGTAPHVIDAAYPGCSSTYLDLGRFYDSAALKSRSGEIIELNRRYKSLYAEAYTRIAAAGEMLPRRCSGLWGESEREKIRKKVSGLVQREFRSAQGRGRIFECFLGAVSCKGGLFLDGSLRERCDRIYVLDNELGMGNYYLGELLPAAIKRGTDLTVCRDCLEPGLISGLIFPALSLALICSDCGADLDTLSCRHIRLDALVSREELSSRRTALRRGRRLGRDCLALATDTLAEAKALHDELEKVYNPHVDFDGVYAEAEKHIANLF